jgi:acetyl esterase/lipase
MTKANRLILFYLLISTSASTQPPDSLRQKYMNDLRVLGRNFTNYFYPNKTALSRLPEKMFVHKIDSSRKLFEARLGAYKMERNGADASFIADQQKEIHYFFDKFILDYPYFHNVSTGKKIALSAAGERRLKKNLPDFNNPRLLANPDFKEYVRGFLRHQSTLELKKARYKGTDNQRLTSTLAIIPRYFSNSVCREFWSYDYINSHIEDWGIKGLEKIISDFSRTWLDTSYKRKINTLYQDARKERENHLTKAYKTVGGYDLDMHLFLPSDSPGKRPVFVFFSGGSWTKGNPEWAFYNCAEYAKKGWVAASVEYRLADRHGTTPFEAVMDARSAIRWLRQHAEQFNIDTARIVASGNSAGGHLVLATALADKWNEATDNPAYSATPNLLLVNSGVYDFIADENTALKRISPVHLVREGLPPMLLIHGTNDQSVPYTTAKSFELEMKKAGNAFEFLTLEGAPHAIWFDRRFTSRVSAARREFLKKYGYTL